MSVFQVATPTGNYPNMGAGYLAKQGKINNKEAYTGWQKIGTIHYADLIAYQVYSCIMLVNGIFRGSTGSDRNPKSGAIEIEYRKYNNTTPGDTRIGVLFGDLDSNNFCYNILSNFDMEIWMNVTAVETVKATVEIVSEQLSNEQNCNIFDFDCVTQSATAPEGAVYAVVRNNASFAESAGYLAKRQYLSTGTTNLGWYKIGSVSVSELNFTDNFSVILLLNGIYASQGQSGAAESGIIEFEGRQREEVLETCRINILAGNLNAGDLSCVIGDNSCDLYLNMPSLYNSFEFTVINEARASTEHSDLFTFDTEFYGASAPSGAVYAVVRNIASYAESIPVASETVFGGAKMWVDGGKLYIKTE